MDEDGGCGGLATIYIISDGNRTTFQSYIAGVNFIFFFFKYSHIKEMDEFSKGDEKQQRRNKGDKHLNTHTHNRQRGKEEKKNYDGLI